MTCGWTWLCRSSPAAFPDTKTMSEGRVRVYKPRQNAFTSCTSWGKLAGTPSILMNDPNRLNVAAQALQAKTSAVKSKQKLNLACKPQSCFPQSPRLKPGQTASASSADAFILGQVACAPVDTRENGFNRDLPAGL